MPLRMGNSAEIYPKRLFLTFTCWVAAGCWALFGIFVLGVITYNLGFKIYAFVATWQVILSSAIFLMVVFIVLRTHFDCPHCGESVLVDIGENKSQAATKRTGVNYWGSVIIDILSSQQFTCMYCGTRYVTRESRK